MLGPIAALMLLTSVGEPIRVDVGRADWSALPPLKATRRPLPTRDMVDRVQRMIETESCKLPGQKAKRFDITIPYAVLVSPDGKASRAVVAETGCAELETFVGIIVAAMAREGDFRPTRETKARWFASELNFSLQ